MTEKGGIPVSWSSEAMKVEVAKTSDAIEILEVQIRSYQSEAEIYNYYSIAPLVETPQEIERQFKIQVFLKAVLEGRIVGSVRGYLKEGTVHIGRLAVEPSLQNQGIETGLLQSIEQHFSTAKRYELFTGHMSVNNLRLYNKYGYREFKRDLISDLVMMIYLEKYKTT